jgi:hypothetical protein
MKLKQKRMAVNMVAVGRDFTAPCLIPFVKCPDVLLLVTQSVTIRLLVRVRQLHLTAMR